MGGDKGEGESPGLFTPTPPASPERLAMAGRLNPPQSRGRRLSRQVSDAPRLGAGSFTHNPKEQLDQLLPWTLLTLMNKTVA
jgi:hypothetical protein